jgi:hypothetical protein
MCPVSDRSSGGYRHSLAGGKDAMTTTADTTGIRATRGRRTFLVAAALGCAAVLGGVAGTAPDSPVARAQTNGFGAGGEYHPVAPARIFDTRAAGINDVAPEGRKPTSPQGNSFDVVVLGRGGVPATDGDVLAVVANVTVVEPTRAGYLSMSPTGAPAGTSSLVNFNAGENVPNLAVLGVGAGGRTTVTLTTPTGPGGAHVLVDVFGWISKSAYQDTGDVGARFLPVGPSRLLDTRSAPVPAGWTGGRPLGAREQLVLPIRGANGLVPASADVTGVMVNVTAVNDAPGNAATFVSATPERTPAGLEPATSVTNLAPGQIKANMAIVPVGADGSITFYNSRGNVHLVIDVLGYLQRGMPDGTRAGRVIPLQAPFRVFDTRQVPFGAAPLGINAREEWSFEAFANSVTLGGVAVGSQSALIGNLTGTDLGSARGGAASTYLTVYPGGGTPPNSSNINVTPGRAVPNMSLLRYGTVGSDRYSISAYNFDGTLHYLLDVYAVVLAD